MPDHAPSPQPPKPVRAWLLGGVVGLVIGAGAVGGAWALSGGEETAEAAKAETFELRGAMVLAGSFSEVGGGDGNCRGLGGYNDIRPGASVTVYDAAGTALATGELGSPIFSNASYRNVCRFPVIVANVPKGTAIYQVEVTHRGKISLNAQDAEAGKFFASLS